MACAFRLIKAKGFWLSCGLKNMGQRWSSIIPASKPSQSKFPKKNMVPVMLSSHYFWFTYFVSHIFSRIFPIFLFPDFGSPHFYSSHFCFFLKTNSFIFENVASSCQLPASPNHLSLRAASTLRRTVSLCRSSPRRLSSPAHFPSREGPCCPSSKRK